MKAIELEKAYNPRDFEGRIYDLWAQSGNFAPRKPEQGEKPFVVVIPPPNVTGVLHLGHGLNNSLQDILIRFHRMMGEPTLWVPGTDHAGIATQNVVEKRLRAEGKERQQLGREAFLAETWKVKEEHHRIITDQLKKIGSSCDWDRERFTLDEGLSDAVQEVFVELYNRGLIYKGTYLVNWSTGVQSALSDDEVEFKEVNGFFYHIKYPLSDGSGHVQLATTRPETMLGDSAVAVHPEDQRYRHLIGKTVDLPLTGRKIPVIADSYVDPEFGTGVVKITPAHDFNDYEVGKRHELAEINIMNPDGTLNENAPEKYRGMSMEQARRAVVADLEELELFVEKEPHRHQVGHCYRTDTVIQPYLSTQWFVRMEPLAKKALAAWENGDIKFFPKKWENTYKSWLTNIRDWCISRQLWWGHRIPAWYAEDNGEMVISRTDPAKKPEYAGRVFRQDEDVLDTWFSSWLWPFSVLGWPEKTRDLEDFFPTTSLVTGYDIIFFWVARMIMASLEFLGEVPFRDIYMTGLVRDKKGRKMSKSLGNGIDPLEIVDEYGADALRFTLAFLATQGQDILLDKETFSLGSRFANKIWNASRYLLMNLEDRNLLSAAEIIAGKHGGLNDLDKWILHRLNFAAGKAREAIGGYRFNDATSAVYEFFWNEFCDWYIEASKLSLYSDDAAEKDRAISLMMYVLEEGLKLLHPFLPYVTEEIYQKLPTGAGVPARSETPLIGAAYPENGPELQFPAEAAAFGSLQELIRQVRTLRSEFTIPPNAKIRFAVRFEEGFAHSDFFLEQDALVRDLTSAEEVIWAPEKLVKDDALAVVGSGFEAYVYIRDMIDVDAALKRLEKNIGKESKVLEQTERKLSNEGFLQKADAAIVDKERQKREEMSRKIEKMRGYIEDLKR
jgi:valyl-tRNA synthetase